MWYFNGSTEVQNAWRIAYAHQGVVTYIPDVLTPATGIKILTRPILDLTAWSHRQKPWSPTRDGLGVGGAWGQIPSWPWSSNVSRCLNHHQAWPLDLTLIPVAGVSTAGIYVTTPCTLESLLLSWSVRVCSSIIVQVSYRIKCTSFTPQSLLIWTSLSGHNSRFVIVKVATRSCQKAEAALRDHLHTCGTSSVL